MFPVVDLAGRFSAVQTLSRTRAAGNSAVHVLGLHVFWYSICSTTLRFAICLSSPPGFSASRWPLSATFATGDAARFEIPNLEAMLLKHTRLAFIMLKHVRELV